MGPTTEFSALAVDSRSISAGCASSSARYNVPAGTLGVGFGCGGSCGECGSWGAVYVEDDFTVVGLPDGTPVSLTARMSCMLGGGGDPQVFIYASTQGILRDANGHVASAYGPPAGTTVANDLTLPVDAIAGQPFRLHFELTGDSLGPVGTGASATFSFAGLPSGTAVVSCQGYVSDRTVAVRRSTWGQLKTAYR